MSSMSLEPIDKFGTSPQPPLMKHFNLASTATSFIDIELSYRWHPAPSQNHTTQTSQQSNLGSTAHVSLLRLFSIIQFAIPEDGLSTSSEVSLYDSDIEFKSSDGFTFQLHRSVLGVTTGGFPGLEMATDGEIVPLTEPANVLAILFAFLYPKPQPDLHGMKFELLLAVAEAAAKYQVFSLVDICNERLPKFIPEHAPAILDHAIKHDYRRLLSETLPHFATKPLLPTLERLQPQYMAPYVKYHEARRSVFKERAQVAFTYKLTESSYSSDCKFSADTICTKCRGTLFVAIAYLESIATVERLREALANPAKDPEFEKILWCCSSSRGRGTLCPFVEDMTKSCQQKINTLPSFATLLGLKL